MGPSTEPWGTPQLRWAEVNPNQMERTAGQIWFKPLQSSVFNSNIISVYGNQLKYCVSIVLGQAIYKFLSWMFSALPGTVLSLVGGGTLMTGLGTAVPNHQVLTINGPLQPFPTILRPINSNDLPAVPGELDGYFEFIPEQVLWRVGLPHKQPYSLKEALTAEPKINLWNHTFIYSGYCLPR